MPMLADAQVFRAWPTCTVFQPDTINSWDFLLYVKSGYICIHSLKNQKKQLRKSGPK